MLPLNDEHIGLFSFHDVVEFININETLTHLELQNEALEIATNLLLIDVRSKIDCLIIICNSFKR
jgi:uncharacterized protein YqkB